MPRRNPIVGGSVATSAIGWLAQAPNDRVTASGFSEAILSRVRAGPSGWRRPCSQFCNVEMLTPIIRANSDCDLSNFFRINLISAGSTWVVRPGCNWPRLIAPACLTLLTSLSKSRLVHARYSLLRVY